MNDRAGDTTRERSAKVDTGFASERALEIMNRRTPKAR